MGHSATKSLVSSQRGAGKIAVDAFLRKKQGLTVDIGGNGFTRSTGDGILREIESTKF